MLQKTFSFTRSTTSRRVASSRVMGRRVPHPLEGLHDKAGKLYGDDKKAQEDGLLEHTLVAAANTEYKVCWGRGNEVGW